MKPIDFFTTPLSVPQRHYEALRAHFVDGLSVEDAAAKFGLAASYFKKLRHEFTAGLRKGDAPFFEARRPGPVKPRTPAETAAMVVSLRKQNLAVTDIKAALEAQGIKLALSTIDVILKKEGFAPLPKRTRRERREGLFPRKIEAAPSVPLEFLNEEFTTERGAGALCLLPIIERLGIVPAIEAAGFPETSALSAAQSVLSLLALKLTGSARWSHDEGWNFDRALGLFAGLNVLPKSTALSTYSYRVGRESVRRFLKALAGIFTDPADGGDFNLDFKAIPHWGDESVLEKNWSGSRNKAIKSLLGLIVQAPASGMLSYTDAELKHADQNGAVLDFVDFWKDGGGPAPKMLIFDSKFTTYQNLDRLNRDPAGIKFLTLRRRGKALVEQAGRIPAAEWRSVNVERARGGRTTLRVHDGPCALRGYEGQVRQLILADNGRLKPAFLITNDFEASPAVLVRKYAGRWLVEQEIAEQVAFFHLNNPSSSIVIKVDFDLALSLLAHNLYRTLARELHGFERCTVPTLHRKFLENGAHIKIDGRNITVALKKKTHLPILLAAPSLKTPTALSWMGSTISFSPAAYS